MDSEYWEAYGDRVPLTQQDSQITSQKRLDDTLANEEEARDWYNTEEAQQLEQRYNSWKQLGTIIKKHQQKLEGRLASYRESWVRLLISSKLGFGLAVKEMGAGPREDQDQSRFKNALIKAMCPHEASKKTHRTQYCEIGFQPRLSRVPIYSHMPRECLWTISLASSPAGSFFPLSMAFFP